MAVFHSTHRDNPRLWTGAEWTPEGRRYLASLEGLTGHRRARLLEGKWAASEGLVYPEFDASVHVIQRMPEGWESWRRIRSIDFGFVHPWVCQWWAIDGDGRMYLYREIYRAKRTTDEHAAEINALSKGESYDATITDHDADVRAILAKAGIQSVLAEKAAVAGRDAVHARLRVQGDGKPRLYVLAGCTHEVDADLYEKKRPTSTLAEFDCYVYPPGKDGKSDKEEPIKDNDHGMDAMRYAVMWMDSANKGYGAWVGASTGTTPPRGEISSPARDTIQSTDLESRMWA
jgi:phage terminase large subunit